MCPGCSPKAPWAGGLPASAKAARANAHYARGSALQPPLPLRESPTHRGAANPRDSTICAPRYAWFGAELISNRGLILQPKVLSTRRQRGFTSSSGTPPAFATARQPSTHSAMVAQQRPSPSNMGHYRVHTSKNAAVLVAINPSSSRVGGLWLTPASPTCAHPSTRDRLSQPPFLGAATHHMWDVCHRLVPGDGQGNHAWGCRADSLALVGPPSLSRWQVGWGAIPTVLGLREYQQNRECRQPGVGT